MSAANEVPLWWGIPTFICHSEECNDEVFMFKREQVSFNLEMVENLKRKKETYNAKIRRKTWTGQRLFVGLDLHKKTWVATVRSRDLHLKTFTVPYGEEAFWKTLNHQFPGAQFIVAYKVGCFGYHIAEYINNNGGRAVIFPPHRIPTTPGVFVKTDRIDSRKLALELSKEQLCGIYQRILSGYIIGV